MQTLCHIHFTDHFEIDGRRCRRKQRKTHETSIFLSTWYTIGVYRIDGAPSTSGSYKANKEFVEEGAGDKEAVIYYFTASWCPVSKRVFPQWEKFVSEYDGKVINGYTLRTRVVDCEKEPELADKANIEGYPTVKLMHGNQVVEYDANVKYETLVEFVESSLQ